MEISVSWYDYGLQLVAEDGAEDYQDQTVTLAMLNAGTDALRSFPNYGQEDSEYQIVKEIYVAMRTAQREE